MERSPITLAWEARGAMIGWLKTSRRILLRLLHLKFGDSVPESMKQAVDSQTDLAILDRWFDITVLATSIDELRTPWGISETESDHPGD